METHATYRALWETKTRMSTPVFILLCTDIALAIGGVVLRRRLEGRMPRGISIGFVVVFGATLIHCLGAIPLAVSLSGNILSKAQFIRLNAYLGFVPMIVFARFFLEAVSSGGAEALFGLNTGLRVDSDFSKAKSLERGGDVDGAIDQYRRYFREEPTSPQALFAIGHLQSDGGNYHDAAAPDTQARTQVEIRGLCPESIDAHKRCGRPVLSG